MVVLDTSLLIDHLRLSRKESTSTHLMRLLAKFGKQELAISLVSIQELYEGKSTLTRKEEERMLSVVAPLTTFPYDYPVAKLAGVIARDSGVLIGTADAAIAATAIENNASLATLNLKHFQGIQGLVIEDLL